MAVLVNSSASGAGEWQCWCMAVLLVHLKAQLIHGSAVLIVYMVTPLRHAMLVNSSATGAIESPSQEMAVL
eukprot:9243949-Lingulodinium_polyedra.AAC.1